MFKKFGDKIKIQLVKLGIKKEDICEKCGKELSKCTCKEK